jgi:hypothetical protein
MEKKTKRQFWRWKLFILNTKKEWIQVNGSLKADCVSTGAGEFCVLFSICAPVGHIGSAFDG